MYDDVCEILKRNGRLQNLVLILIAVVVLCPHNGRLDLNPFPIPLLFHWHTQPIRIKLVQKNAQHIHLNIKIGLRPLQIERSKHLYRIVFPDRRIPFCMLGPDICASSQINATYKFSSSYSTLAMLCSLCPDSYQGNTNALTSGAAIQTGLSSRPSTEIGSPPGRSYIRALVR